MSNVLINKANELKPQTRVAVEAELGRRLNDDEDVSIMAFSMHEAPSGEALHQAGQKLEEHFKRIDKQTANESGNMASVSGGQTVAMGSRKFLSAPTHLA